MAFDNKCKWSYDSERDRLTAILPNYTIIETTLNKEVLNRDGMGALALKWMTLIWSIALLMF